MVDDASGELISWSLLKTLVKLIHLFIITFFRDLNQAGMPQDQTEFIVLDNVNELGMIIGYMVEE